MPKIFASNPSVLCFRKFPVGKSFMDKRGGEYQDFPSKIFCLTWPKSFVGESFTVALISGIENFGIKRGMGIKIFCQKVFVSQCRIFPEGNPLLLLYFRAPKKFGDEGGRRIKILRRIFFVSHCRKFPWGNPLLLH